MFKLFSILSLAALALSGMAQVGGGSAAYGGQRGQSGAEAARASELAKRNFPLGDGRFFDASILMNVEADEYVAVFGINQEGKTLEEAQRKMDSSVKAFTASLQQLKVAPTDYHLDFVAQNRIYGYDTSQDGLIKEVVVGFEVKKNIAVRYKDKAMLDRLTLAASKAEIFDLVKVDYVIKDIAPIRKRLLQEAARVIKAKVADQEELLGVKVGQLTLVAPGLLSTYYPTEMYDSYVAQESEEVIGYRQNVNVQRARKPKTFYFNALSPKDFDHVINPAMVEPSVQVTIYVRVKY